MSWYNNCTFALEYYLIKNKIPTNILTFAKSNKLDIQYTFYLQNIQNNIQNNIHNLITTDYRLVTISESLEENDIRDYKKHNLNMEIYIVYNGLKMIISKKYNNIDILAECNNFDIKDHIKYADKLMYKMNNYGFMDTRYHIFSPNMDLSKLKKIMIIEEKMMYLIKDMNIEVIFHGDMIIPNLIKNNWKSLTITGRQKYNFNLCTKLEKLEIKCNYDDIIPSIPTLKELKIKKCKNILHMPNLESLEIYLVEHKLDLNNFPKLTKLYIIKSCKYELNFSTTILIDLHLPKRYDWNITFPLSLKYLICERNFNQCCYRKLNLPPNLIYLRINRNLYPINILNIPTVKYNK